MAGLSVAMMSALLGCAAAELEDIEAGQLPAPLALLSRCARVFGMSEAELLIGNTPSPMALLFRALSVNPPSLQELIDSGAHEALGDFQRTIREEAELTTLLQEPAQGSSSSKPLLEPVPIGEQLRAPFGADVLAQRVRSLLGIGDVDPIPALGRLLQERLGIRLIFVDPEILSPEIEGASTQDPRPAILVNLLFGGAQWWRTRMVLAHELCHVLFDRIGDGQKRAFLITPLQRPEDNDPRLRLPDELARYEQRANAFAAYLLAPPAGVRRQVRDLAPTSQEAISRVSTHYQVGWKTAINLLTNIYRLSREQRRAMAELPVADAALRRRTDHPDRYLASPGIRDDAYVTLVAQALQQGRIDALEARRYLRVSLSEPLPEHPLLSELQRQPLRSADSRARDAAERYVAERCDDPTLYATAVARDAGGWIVTFARRSPDADDVVVGTVELTAALQPAVEAPWLGAAQRG